MHKQSPLHIGLIDYGLNNIHSIAKALEKIEVCYSVTSEAQQLNQYSHFILPGVGAFGSGVNALKKLGLAQQIIKQVSRGKPILGICLGMQLLYESSAESPNVNGLGVLAGEVKALKADADNQIRLPHVGWNALVKEQPCELLNNIEPNSDFYFVHSYYVSPTQEEDTIAQCLHGDYFPAIVQKENIVGVQFHPEKSLSGLALLKAFSRL